MPNPAGNKVLYVLKADDRFGPPGKGSTVIDPEIRLGMTERKPKGYRYAVLLCDCGTKYAAQISHLARGRSWRCPGCAMKAVHAARRHVGGTVKRSSRVRGTGYTVTVYVGYYRTRAQAEAAAKRARAVLLPADARSEREVLASVLGQLRRGAAG